MKTFLAALLVVAVLIFVYFQHDYLQRLIIQLFAYIQSHKSTGSILYILFFGSISCLLVPTTLPSILGGIVFKPLGLSVLISLLGSQFGIILGFLIGRMCLRPWILNKYSRNTKFLAIQKALETDAFKLVVLLRLTPLFPFGICNYLLSTTNIDIKMVMLASLIGNFPGSLMHSFVGSLIKDLGDVDGYETPLRIRLITALLGVSFTILCLTYITVFGKRALRDIVDIQDFDYEEVSLVEDGGDDSAISQDMVSNLEPDSSVTIDNLPQNSVDESHNRDNGKN